MNTSVALLSVLVGINVIFLMTCLLVHRYFREKTELLWFAVALFVGMLELLLSVYLPAAGKVPGDFPPIIAAVTYILAPLSYLLVAKALMVHFGRKGLKVLSAIPLTALLLLVLAIPPTLENYPVHFTALQITVGLTLVEVAWIGWNAPGRIWRNRAISAAATVVGLAYLSRIPAAFWYFGNAFTREQMIASPVFSWSLFVVVVFIPVGMLLFLSSLVSGIIADYREKSEKDGLTGIYNRRTFDEKYPQMAMVGGILLIADIDHFKQVNDKYGHAIGDLAICNFAGLLTQLDVFCGRMGGEEFAVYIPRLEIAQGKMVAEGIRTAYSMTEIRAGDIPARLTASFGVTSCAPDEPLHQCFSRADAALYEAKRNGRNRVEIHNESLCQAVA